MELERLEVRVAVVAEALLVGERELGGEADELARDLEERGRLVARLVAPIEEEVARVEGGDLLLDRGDIGERCAVVGLERRVGVDLPFERRLLRPLLLHQGGVFQAVQEACERLLRVPDVKELGARLALLLCAVAPEGDEGRADRPAPGEAPRDDDVAITRELGHRLEPPGAPGVAADEDGVAVLGARLVPGEEARGLDRGAVGAIHAEDGEVVVEARVGEVLRVAAEEGDRALGGEDEAHIGVLLVRREGVLPAGVEGDDVASLARRVVAALLDRAHRPLDGGVGLGVAHAGRLRGADLVGHVLDCDGHVELEVRALHIRSVRPGAEALGHEVGAARGDLADAVRRDVVVREDEPRR